MKPQSDFTETQISSTPVFDGRLLHVRQDEVRLPDGSSATREYIVHPGAVMILALLDDGRLLLERQFRYPMRQHMYELPAGKLDPGEDPLESAKRELLEETGYVAQQWRALTTVYPIVAYCTEQIHIYLARGLSFQGQRLDQGEFVEVLEISIKQGLDWVHSGRIRDAKTVLGLLWAERIVQAQW